jgi:hypothetical protein
MTNLPDLPKGSALAAVTKAKTPADRAKAQALAGNYLTSPNFPEPVPAFFLDLPYSDDNDAVTDQIALAMLVAEYPDAVSTEGGSVAFRDLVGETVTVWDVRAKAGGIGAGWKAYLLLDVTVGDSELHQVANTGAKQIVVRLARAWADGQIPLKGTVTEIATAGSTGNKPLAFICETDF